MMMRQSVWVLEAMVVVVLMVVTMGAAHGHIGQKSYSVSILKANIVKLSVVL